MICGAPKPSSAKARRNSGSAAARSRFGPVHTRKKPPINSGLSPARYRLCATREAEASADRPIIDNLSDLGANAKIADPAKSGAVFEPDRAVFALAIWLV